MEIKEHNALLLTQVKNKIENLEKEASSTYDATIIQGKRIPNSKKKLYEKLEKLESLLDFNPGSEPKYMVFEGLVTTTDRYHEVMQLLNDKELELDIPEALNMYGIIPEINIEAPRPIKFKETQEHYESYLKDYYQKFNITPIVRNDGVRDPYPHEQYKWTKGQATKPNAHYTSAYYNRLRQDTLNNQAKTTSQPKTENTNNAKHETFTRRTYTDPSSTTHTNSSRKKAGTGRYRVKNKEAFKNIKDKILNLDSAAGADETINAFIKGVKRVGCIALIIAGGFAIAEFIIPTLIFPIIKALGFLPQSIITALTGSGTKINGDELSSTEVSNIRSKLINLIIGIGGTVLATYIAKHHRKKSKNQDNPTEEVKTTEIPKPTPPPTPEPPRQTFSPEILQKQLRENRNALEQLKNPNPNTSQASIQQQRRQLEEQRRFLIEQINNLNKGNGGFSR